MLAIHSASARTFSSQAPKAHEAPKAEQSSKGSQRRTLPQLHSLSKQKQLTHSTNSTLSRSKSNSLSRSLSARPFVTRGPAPSARLVFGSAPLRAPSRTCSKGACPLAFPPPRPVRGAREADLARSQGIHSPKKRPPPFLTPDPRLGSPLPHPVHGEVGRESERGRQ